MANDKITTMRKTQDMIERGESVWNGDPVQLEIVEDEVHGLFTDDGSLAKLRELIRSGRKPGLALEGEPREMLVQDRLGSRDFDRFEEPTATR